MGTAILDRLADLPGATALLFDVDGTLAPIVADRAAARVPDATRRELERLRRTYALVACVTGRRSDDAARVVGVPGLEIVGEHGLELADDAEAWAVRLHAFARATGLPVEEKRLTVTFHFRGARDEEAAVDRLREVARDAARAGLVARWGRKVLELRPPVPAHKGTAVRALVEREGLRRALYAGDDETDLDAFAALDGLDLAVRVAVASAEGPAGLRGAADLVVDDPAALAALLRRL